MTKLGWCDFCLRVNDVATSRAFYADLGFWRVEGADEEGWSVLSNGETRLGLFSAKFMDDDAFSLNFRGGDVVGIAEHLVSQGRTLLSGPKVGANGGASASLRDPDGNLIFLDSAPGETRNDQPLS